MWATEQTRQLYHCTNNSSRFTGTCTKIFPSGQDPYFTEGKKPRQGPRSRGSRAGIITQVLRWTNAQFRPHVPDLSLSFTFWNQLRSPQRAHHTTDPPAAMMPHSHGDSGLPSSSQHQNEPRSRESPAFHAPRLPAADLLNSDRPKISSNPFPSSPGDTFPKAWCSTPEKHLSPTRGRKARSVF